MGLVERVERFLNISAAPPTVQSVRLRAIWTIGLVVVLLQIVNGLVLYLNYGRFVEEHPMILIASLVTLGAIVCIRWWKRPGAYAALYAALIFGGTYASASISPLGINTAMLPLICIGPVLCGFMAGQRAAILFGLAAVVFLTALYALSLSGPPVHARGDFVLENNRYVQAVFAVTLATCTSVIVSERLNAVLQGMADGLARATQAEAAKSQFLATMSHELRTPLNGVIGLTDALLEADLPERERRLARTIRDSGEALLVTLNDFLDLTKVEAGRITLAPRPAAPREIARQIGDVWRETAAARGLALHVEVDAVTPAMVMIDDLRLRQVLHNLVSNAVKFTDQGFIRIAMTAAAQGPDRVDLQVRVIDTGRGVPDHLREAIFQPFVQAEEGDTRRFGGTGLGLSICARFAELMGGVVVLARSGPEGSDFRLTAPATLVDAERCAPSGEDDGAAGQGAPTPGGLADLKILVAEDNPVNRMVVGELLKAQGAALHFVENGAECVERVAAEPFDLILMDKHMPVMGGEEATRIIRESGGRVAATPIIAVTADAMAGQREAMLAAGMNDYVAKPLRAEDLHRAIIRVLRERRGAA